MRRTRLPKNRDEKGPVGLPHRPENTPLLVGMLLNRLLSRTFLGCRLWMVRNRLDGRFVHRSRTAGFGERGTGRDNPLLGGHRALVARAGLNPAGVNILLGFTAGNVGFDVNRAFGS